MAFVDQIGYGTPFWLFTYNRRDDFSNSLHSVFSL